MDSNVAERSQVWLRHADHIETYWIVFDEPQIGGDGDGPYWAGAVEAEYLRRVDQE